MPILIVIVHISNMPCKFFFCDKSVDTECLCKCSFLDNFGTACFSRIVLAYFNVQDVVDK